MARVGKNTRHSNYVIRIVCEGDKTEPLFFTSLCDLYCRGNEALDVRTVPQPRIPLDEKTATTSRGGYKGKKRQVKSAENMPPEEEPITGVPPLKWVQYARRILSEGVDESWAVYDKDEHPKHAEAFEEANKVIDGKKVNIAFSSRSFEYYLLLHFEYLYYSFEETECGERIKGNKHRFECGTGKNPDKDCDGKTCINGYARKHGYWKETKSSVSTFPLVADRLVKGLINACRLRAESDANTNEPMYNRNPYTNVDLLVGRLIGKETICYDSAYHYQEHGADWSVKFNDEGLLVTNHKSGSELFHKGMFVVYDWEHKSEEELNTKSLLLSSGESQIFPCTLKQTQVISIKITPDKELLLLPKFVI